MLCIKPEALLMSLFTSIFSNNVPEHIDAQVLRSIDGDILTYIGSNSGKSHTIGLLVLNLLILALIQHGNIRNLL